MAKIPRLLPTHQNNSRGVLLMLVGMFLFGASDIFSKILTEAFHPVQILWFRQLALLIGVLFVLMLKGRQVLHTQWPQLQILRGALAVGSGLLFIYAVRHVPLADAVAASFVAPFFLTILGVLVLGETVGIRRWTAVAIGFIGALIITRPGLDDVHPAILLVVMAAACYAARQILGRVVSANDRTVTTVAYTAITASLLTTLALPFVWQTPESGRQWLILLSMSLCAGVAEILVIRSLELAEAVVIAPIHYTLIIWGTLYGFLVFGQLPDQWTWLGTAIIVAAGLYNLHRDRMVKQALQTQARNP